MILTHYTPKRYLVSHKLMGIYMGDLILDISMCNSMVGSEIWDKYHEYCIVGVAKLHEAKPSAIHHSHYNTSGNYPKFHSQPRYHRLIPYSRTPAYLQAQEDAVFVARWVGIN